MEKGKALPLSLSLTPDSLRVLHRGAGSGRGKRRRRRRTVLVPICRFFSFLVAAVVVEEREVRTERIIIIATLNPSSSPPPPARLRPLDLPDPALEAPCRQGACDAEGEPERGREGREGEEQQEDGGRGDAAAVAMERWPEHRRRSEFRSLLVLFWPILYPQGLKQGHEAAQRRKVGRGMPLRSQQAP